MTLTEYVEMGKGIEKSVLRFNRSIDALEEAIVSSSFKGSENFAFNTRRGRYALVTYRSGDGNNIVVTGLIAYTESSEEAIYFNSDPISIGATVSFLHSDFKLVEASTWQKIIFADDYQDILDEMSKVENSNQITLDNYSDTIIQALDEMHVKTGK